MKYNPSFVKIRNTAVAPHRSVLHWFFAAGVIFSGFLVSFSILPTVFSQAVSPFQNTPASQNTETPETASLIPFPYVKPLFSPKMHPWGNFESGAWRLSRMSTEVFTRDQKTENITTTENCVTLQKTESEIYSLVVESLVTLAGKSVNMEPQTLSQGAHGLNPAEFPDFRILRQEILSVDGQPISCLVVQFSFSDEKLQKTATFWVNQSRFPYIFQKEIQIRDAVSGKSEEFTRTEVTTLNCQVVVFGKILKGYRSKIESEFPQRKASVTVVSSPEIPGGTVSRISRETDLQGHVLQVATTELIDFGLKEGEHQNELFRNNPIRVARSTAVRPSVDVTSIGEVQWTLKFSNNHASSVTPPEPPEKVRFLDRLFPQRREKENSANISKNNKRESIQKIPGREVSLSENGSRKSLPAEAEDVPKGHFAQPYLVHQDTVSPSFVPLSAVEEAGTRKVEKKSPLYQLRKKDLRKKRAEISKNVAIRETADSGQGVLEKKGELIDLYPAPAEPEAQKENRTRASWRRHWRAVIIGNQPSGS